MLEAEHQLPLPGPPTTRSRSAPPTTRSPSAPAGPPGGPYSHPGPRTGQYGYPDAPDVHDAGPGRVSSAGHDAYARSESSWSDSPRSDSPRSESSWSESGPAAGRSAPTGAYPGPGDARATAAGDYPTGSAGYPATGGYPAAPGGYGARTGAYAAPDHPEGPPRTGAPYDDRAGRFAPAPAPDQHRDEDDLYRAPVPAAAGASRGPLVIGLAFAVAIVIGVGIGLATAPHHQAAKQSISAAPAAVDPQAAPAIPDSVWGGNRQAGAVRNVNMLAAPANRTALRYVYGKKIGQPASAVTIPSLKLFYGVILGPSAATDHFWAVGLATVNGSPDTLVVWDRTGAGAWRVASRGAGSCSIVPSSLYVPWKGRPAFC